MYILMVVFLLFVFPITSILAEMFLFKSAAGILLLVGKWFVFWAVGIRLFTAGLRQAIQPRYTAEEILGLKSSDQLIVVQELGFANISMGAMGIVTIFNGNWVLPAAIVGSLFYGFAGVRHIFTKEKNMLENTAMVSNLMIAAILLVYLIRVMVH